MPIVSGRLTPAGAVVDIVVGVGPRRLALLQRLGLPVPAPVFLKAQIDTGANITGLTGRVFSALELPPVGSVAILTPSTRPDAPHHCDLFDVTLSFVADGRAQPFGGLRVIAADGWHPGAEQGVEALIGRDVLDRCVFSYLGPDRAFTFAF